MSVPTNLIFDLSNITHVTRHGKAMKGVKSIDPYFIPLLFKETISFIDSFVRKMNVDGVIIAADNRPTWRKEIFPSYKANRLKETRDEAYEEIIKTIQLLEKFFTTCTGIPVIRAPRAEADDVIAVACQTLPLRFIVLSTDRDFVQLINDRVSLYTPVQNKYRESDDPRYDLFEKCIRGDRGDNISSAYPRVRATKLKEAWNDQFAMQNLLETVLPSGERVRDKFELNKKLIDLSAQPEDVRDGILKEISKASEPKQFSNIELYKFCGENGLATVVAWLESCDRLLRKQFSSGEYGYKYENKN